MISNPGIPPPNTIAPRSPPETPPPEGPPERPGPKSPEVVFEDPDQDRSDRSPSENASSARFAYQLALTSVGVFRLGSSLFRQGMTAEALRAATKQVADAFR